MVVELEQRSRQHWQSDRSKAWQDREQRQVDRGRYRQGDSDAAWENSRTSSATQGQDRGQERGQRQFDRGEHRQGDWDASREKSRPSSASRAQDRDRDRGHWQNDRSGYRQADWDESREYSRPSLASRGRDRGQVDRDRLENRWSPSVPMARDRRQDSWQSEARWESSQALALRTDRGQSQSDRDRYRPSDPGDSWENRHMSPAPRGQGRDQDRGQADRGRYRQNDAPAHRTRREQEDLRRPRSRSRSNLKRTESWSDPKSRKPVICRFFLTNDCKNGDACVFLHPEEVPRYTGKIKSLSEREGYGFISCEELRAIHKRDVFVHSNQFGNFEVGNQVSFVMTLNNVGHPQAYHLEHESGRSHRGDELSEDESRSVPRTRYRTSEPGDYIHHLLDP